MSDTQTVSVSILDKRYQVSCPPEQEAELVVSASYLDKRMRSIRKHGKAIDLERIAVMAALNISHELLKAAEHNEGVKTDNEQVTSSVNDLSRKIDQALYSMRQLKIS